MFFALGNRRRWVPVGMAMGYACGLGLLLWHGQSDEARFYFVSWFAPSRFVDFLAGVLLARVFLTSSGQKLAGVQARRRRRVSGCSSLLPCTDRTRLGRCGEG